MRNWCLSGLAALLVSLLSAGCVARTRSADAGGFDGSEWAAFPPDAWLCMTPLELNATGGLSPGKQWYWTTVNEWTPTPETPVTVLFDWAVASDDDLVDIVTRSDASIGETGAAPVTGLHVRLSARENRTWIARGSDADSAEDAGTARKSASLPISAGATYRVKLVDNGRTLRLYVDDMSAPILVGFNASASKENRVVVYSRDAEIGSDSIGALSISQKQTTD